MLLLLGGIIGCGRKTLAKQLEAHHGFHRYDMNRHRFHGHYRDERGVFQGYSVPEDTDEGRMRIYRKSVEEFPMLSKLHANVVIERTLHRAEPRRLLLSEAQKYFSPVLFVWVQASESIAERNIEGLVAAGALRDVESGLAEREKEKKDFQDFAEPPIVFEQYGTNEESAERLWELVQKLAA